MEFVLIIKFILIGLMLLSAVSYLFKRSDNKHSLQQAIENHQTIRQLNDDEFQLLKPYLDDKTKVRPYKYQSSLVSQDVSLIYGPCVRHSLTTNGSESSYYFVIGNIEVFFPYGMDSYTMEDNVAEVVFTERYAFVVNLNGYSLADAKADRDGESLRNEQWEQGSRGQFKTVTEEDINQIEQMEQPDAGVSALIAQAKNKRCEILEQREETPLEAQRKNRQNLGFLSAVFLVLAVIVALMYRTEQDLWAIFISGMLFIVAAIFYFYHPKRVNDKINRVRGTIEGKDPTSKTIMVGDTLILSYPNHWQNCLPEKTTIDADMDVAVAGKALLRYGNTLSLSREIEQYGPPKFWGRNCFIFIVGIVLSFVIYLFSGSLKDDAIFTYRFLSDQIVTLDINDNDSLKKTAIDSGDLINLNLSRVWCDVTQYYSCNQVFVSNEVIDLTEIVNLLPSWAQKSSSGSLVKTTRDAEVETLELYGSLFSAYNDSYYSNNQKKYTKLLNIEELTQVTDEACADDKNKRNDNNSYYYGDDSCDRLKEIFTILLTDEKDQQLPTWADLVAYAKTQQNRSAIIYTSTANEISSIFSSLSHQFLNKQKESITALLTAKQNSPSTVAISLMGKYNASVSVPDITRDRYQTLEYNIAIANGLGQVSITGLVNQVNYHDDGTLASISINPDIRYQTSESQLIPAAVMMFIVFIIIAVITLLQLLVILNKIRVNKARLRKIQADYRNLMF
ncbi:IgaA/UmoB family intracellular growth attenuator [Orbus mooreae]|uniref:IgaA/UmoB family intracellular growth attenuator n=1 Tax=Orbus mooreae TaxID=3074107 RepID=UPI00370D7519